MDLQTDFSITPSLVLEYLYCPRFIYFMEVLGISQNEDNRYKVMEGRNVHKLKAMTNKDYQRKKLNVIKKEINKEMYSKKYCIHGIVDEVLFLDDGTAAPLDYKYAEFKEKIYRTYKLQSAMYAMMINDNYDLKVEKGYIVYTRSKNYLVEINFNEKDFDEVEKIVNDIKRIVVRNYFPKRTSVRSRCLDCCYRNICVK